MIEKYAIAMIGITGLMVFWAIVHRLWKKEFADQHTDEDVLAGRSDCGNCGCTTSCVNKLSEIKDNKG